jgi:molybdopterin synthase sulfur carrier subunit
MTSGLRMKQFSCGPSAVDRRPPTHARAQCKAMALCAVSRNQRDEKESRRVKIHIPTPLRQFAAKQATVTVSAATVGEALDELTSTHPELKKHLYSEEGKLRAFVNIYLNDEDIRYLSEKENTAVKDSDSLSIIPSIAGGCGALNK